MNSLVFFWLLVAAAALLLTSNSHVNAFFLRNAICGNFYDPLSEECFLERFLKREAVAATSNDKDQTATTGLIGSMLVGDKFISSVVHVVSKMKDEDRWSAQEMIRFVFLNTLKSCDFSEKMRKGLYHLSFASEFASAQSKYNEFAKKLSEDDQQIMNLGFASIEEGAWKLCPLIIGDSFNKKE